jgi:hypothetical protein
MTVLLFTEINTEIFDGHFLLEGHTFLTPWLELYLHPVLTTVNSVLNRGGAYSTAGLHNPRNITQNPGDTAPR